MNLVAVTCIAAAGLTAAFGKDRDWAWVFLIAAWLAH